MQILSFIQSSALLMIIPWFPVEPSKILGENGREKEGRGNGNVNRHTIEQPSKKRKEDFPESKSEVKKPSPEKKKVFKPFDHHPLLVQNQSVL